MKVFVTKPVLLESAVWEEGYAKGFSDELKAQAGSHCQVVERACDADLVILIESNIHKAIHSAPMLLKEPMLTTHCEKVCSINYEDSPMGFLRGLYSSLEGDKFDRTIHKSWPAFYLPNEEIYDVDKETVESASRTYLFSFIGAMSHPVRARLIERYVSNEGKGYRVGEVDRWYDHTAGERKEYVKTILASQFAVCPRGHACYTHRIVEAMALGRAPVIIADGWIPFSISESDYYIQVPEERVESLDLILEARKQEAESLGRRAYEVWLKYFSRQARSRAAVDAARELVERGSAPLTLATYRRRWQSSGFKKANQILLWQRAWRRITKSAGDRRVPQHRAVTG